MIMVEKKISDHFNSKEFKCDCCDKIKIDENLVFKIENIIKRLNASKCIVSSGYRCEKYDMQIGGFLGRHFEGLAMDCCFYDKEGKLIPSKIVCCVAFDLHELNGIAKIDEYYVHLDNRKGSTYYGDETRGNSSYWSNPYQYFGVTINDVKRYTGNIITYQVHSIEDERYYSNVAVGSVDYAGVLGKTIDGILIDDLEYKVRVKGILFNKWLTPVIGRNDYAGWYGHKVTGIAIKNAEYRVHIKGGGWLPPVSGYNINDRLYGYAGNGKEIDALQILRIMV